MSKIVITIEDTPNGVKTVANPSFETMMHKLAAGYKLTSADAYALTAINAILKESKSSAPTKIYVPRIGR